MKPIRKAIAAVAVLGLSVLGSSVCSPRTPEPGVDGPETSRFHEPSPSAPSERGNTEAPGAELGEVTPVSLPAVPPEASADPATTADPPSVAQTESTDVDEVDPVLEEIEAMLSDLDELLSDTEDALEGNEGDI